VQLLPRDEKFFDLLIEQARIAFNASSLLADGLGDGAVRRDSHATAQKVRDLERKGDQAVRQIYRRLHKTFITPIDPEDIHQLASRVDEITDHLDAVAYRFEAFELESSSERMTEIARMVQGCVAATLEAIETLGRDGMKKPDELTSRCEEINRREVETENRVREVIRNLFKTERDPIALMKQKEVYELLESTADCCENVADVLEAIAVKNS
jgi:uncharacterized protein Yka (UPF0111/DUF47 family)